MYLTFQKIKLPTIDEIVVSKSEIICQFTAAAVKDLSGLEEWTVKMLFLRYRLEACFAH